MWTLKSRGYAPIRGSTDADQRVTCKVGGWYAASPSWDIPCARPPTMSHSGGRQSALHVVQPPPGLGPGDDLQCPEGWVAHHQYRMGRVVETTMQALRVSARVLFRHSDVDRKSQAGDPFRVLHSSSEPLGFRRCE
jgi:hypothetical protein